MSFIRLLSMGRSFNGQKGQLSRYKVSELNLVPKFPVVKSVGPTGTQRLPCVGPEVSTPKNGEATSRVGARGRLVVAKSPLRSFVATIAIRLVGSNPFSSERSARNTRRMVQSELLLQNIKVVRNDLHDADLEIRPLPTLQSRASAAGVPADRADAGVWKKTLRRVGELARSVVFLH